MLHPALLQVHHCPIGRSPVQLVTVLLAVVHRTVEYLIRLRTATPHSGSVEASVNRVVSRDQLHESGGPVRLGTMPLDCGGCHTVTLQETAGLGRHIEAGAQC